MLIRHVLAKPRETLETLEMVLTLLGTQMIAKGLDFPNVTLVGVLNAATSLNLPDFRSVERTNFLIQVAGRAGRADKKWKLLFKPYGS